MPSETDPGRSPHPPTRRLGIGLGLALATILGLPTLWMLNRRVRPPASLGLDPNGRLRACPESPNCVVSENHDPEHHIEPLPFAGSLDHTRTLLRQILAHRAGTRLVEEQPDYLRYEFRTAVCRFVDDVEFRLDQATRQVHVRSASRVGYSDLGTNRRRIEGLRESLRRALAEPSQPPSPG